MTTKPNLLCIVPPYNYFLPPHGAAALLGYLKANGCDEFDFLDLRLWASNVYMPTYQPVGVFGDSYVVDVPDLPIVLKLIEAFDRRAPFVLSSDDPAIVSYCLDRGINPDFLVRYLTHLDRFFEAAFAQLPHLEFVGFSTWTTNLLTTLMAAAHLKRRARPPFVVLGGPQVTESANSARLALTSRLADVVVRGEGEVTLFELFKAHAKPDRRLEEIPGCMVLDDATGECVRNDRPLMKMWTKPLPDFSAMPIAAYQKHSFPGTLLPFEISRGCTDKCAFCSEWVFWKNFRPDTVEHVIDQLKELKARYGAAGFCFSDSLLNGVKNRLVGLAEGILSAGLDIHWSGYMRANIDEETARLVTRAGCQIAVLGIESMSDETLALMNKRRVKADNINALTALLDAGISLIVAGIIPGFPGDTTERFIATARELHGLQTRYPLRLRMNVEPFIVSPGQPLFAKLEEFGLSSRGWDEQVLDIAPRYRHVTDDIPCTVSGANQGLSRIGQLRIAHTLNSFNPLTRRVEQDPYMYGPAEDLRTHAFLFEPVAPGWLLGEFKSSIGGRTALIVSAAEQEEWDRESVAAAFRGETERAFSAFVDRLAQVHLVHGLGDAPDLTMGMMARGEADGTAAALSPFTVCRRLDGGDLLLADYHTRASLRAAARFEPIVRALKGAFVTADAVAALAARERIADGEARTFREELAQAGLLVTEPQTWPEPAVSDVASPSGVSGQPA